MHNMIVEERRLQHPNEPVGPWLEEAAARFQPPVTNNNPPGNNHHQGTTLFGQVVADEVDLDVQEALASHVAMMSCNMMDAEEHFWLKQDLIKHIWDHWND